MKLAIDFEHPSRLWWESGGQQLWDGLAEAFDGSSIVVDESLALSWVEEARKIPGWDAGPEWAPHPVRVSPLAEDEDV
jgi:hypothetical protein